MRNTPRAAAMAALLALPLCAAALADVELTQSADVLGTLAPDGDEHAFAFDAAQGDLLNFTVTSKPGKAIDLALTLEDPTGQAVDLPGFGGFSDRRGKASLRKYPIPAAGAWRLVVAGAGTGDFRLQWWLGKKWKRVPRLDLRAGSLGAAHGGESAEARWIDPASATRIDVETPGGELDGASLEIPAGAVSQATCVTVTTAPTPELYPDPYRAAGPALAVGPDGLVLAEPATLTLPYDPVLVPYGSAPEDALRVVRIDETKAFVVLVPVAVDTAAHRVAVTTDVLGTFVPMAARGAPQMAGVEVWGAQLVLQLVPAAGTDSRGRLVMTTWGRTRLNEDGTLSGTLSQVLMTWHHDADGHGVLDVGPEEPPFASPTTWTATDGGRSITAGNTAGQVGTSVVGDGGVAFVNRIAQEAGETYDRLDVEFRRPGARVSRFAVAGTYTFGGLRLAADEQPDRPMHLDFARALGTLTLRTDGTWSVSGTESVGTLDPAVSDYWTRTGRIRASGDFEIVTEPGLPDSEAVLLLRDGLSPIRLFPSRGFDAFVALGVPTPESPDVIHLVGVRRAQHLAPAALDATYEASSLGIGPWWYGMAPGTPHGADFTITRAEERLAFDGTDSLSIEPVRWKYVYRDESAPTGVVVETREGGETLQAGVKLRATGEVAVSGVPDRTVDGAFTPDLGFGFTLDTPGKWTVPFALRALLRRPRVP